MKTHLLSRTIHCENDAPIYELIITRPKEMEYQPGQFIKLDIPYNEKTIPRFYSLASIPQDNNLRLLVKYIPNGIASEYFKKMEINSSLEISGPFGHFLPKTLETSVYFVTGTGIAPVLSHWKYLEKINFKGKIKVYWGLRNEEHVYLKDEISKIGENEQIDIEIILSQPKLGTGKRITSFLTDDVLKNYNHYFAVGNPEMVKEVSLKLKELNIPKEKITIEYFTPGSI